MLRAKISDPSHLEWQSVGSYRPEWTRRLAVTSRLSARLFRAGFHALAVLPSGAFVGAVAGAIVSLRPGEREFRATHIIARGTRPLHVAVTSNGALFWGEYFDNSARDEVHVYASSDSGTSWQVAYTFPKSEIRHVHNIVHDPWEECLWVLTGDYGDECRILRASNDFSRVETVLKGNQQARAVAFVPAVDGLYFSSDTPLEQNYIYRLDRSGNLTRLASINSSSIYGCRVRERVFFSTMAEPSEVNRDGLVRIYGGSALTAWESQLKWKKDSWPMGLFQYGNAILPDGDNSTSFLAATTVAVHSDDMVTSLFCVGT
ncbi:MAG TPA: hypothetical protein VKV39_14470 [Candidatus Sulfotelmatobacter sp.]|nr:hypothetical protein [Candidatus Sulfotelmatobacter sp.]